MPPIMKQKALVIPLIVFLIGAYCHWRGRHLNSDQNAELKQVVGVAFDIISSNLAWLLVKHKQNKEAIAQNVQTIHEHAEAINAQADNLASVANPANPILPTGTEVKPNV